ncbi:MAG: hypothetical protein J6J66_01955 [Clostridia bacterium]|nr:hypothetical protein [Clostridia bacterium]
MPNSVFEGLDEIIERQKQAEERSRKEHEEILEAIKKANAKNDQADSVQKTVNQRNQSWSLKNFITHSIHEYMWIGTEAEFDKEKKMTLLWILASILWMFVCTIVSSVSFKFYSTFTLFENIWLVLMLFVLKYKYKTKKNYLALEYSLNSFSRFEFDADGVLRCTEYKKKYQWFFVLACIAFLLNTIFAWVENNNMPLLVTFLELGTLALNIFTVYKVTGFFGGYGPIRFTEISDAGKAKTVLVLDTAMNKLYTEEDFFNTFSFMR